MVFFKVVFTVNEHKPTDVASSMYRSDYEEMPLQNGRAIKATAKYQDETDSD